MKNGVIWLAISIVLIAAGIGVYFFTKKDTDVNANAIRLQQDGNNTNTGTVPLRAQTFAGPNMKGQTVKDVQVFINSLGYSPRLVEDSHYGPKTAAAMLAVFGKNAISHDDWERRSSIRYSRP